MGSLKHLIEVELSMIYIYALLKCRKQHLFISFNLHLSTRLWYKWVNGIWVISICLLIKEALERVENSIYLLVLVYIYLHHTRKGVSTSTVLESFWLCLLINKRKVQFFSR